MERIVRQNNGKRSLQLPYVMEASWKNEARQRDSDLHQSDSLWLEVWKHLPKLLIVEHS